MSLAFVNWLLDEKHKDLGEFHDGTFSSWSKARSTTHPYHYKDGTTYWVSKYDLTPDDDWL